MTIRLDVLPFFPLEGKGVGCPFGKPREVNGKARDINKRNIYME